MQKHLPIQPPHITIMGSHPIRIRPFGVIESDANENSAIEPVQTPRVRISCALNGTLDELSRAIVRWLHEAPPGLADVRLEGVFEGFSTTVMLSMPVRLWSFLSGNDAISCVGLVKSSNRMRFPSLRLQPGSFGEKWLKYSDPDETETLKGRQSQPPRQAVFDSSKPYLTMPPTPGATPPPPLPMPTITESSNRPLSSVGSDENEVAPRRRKDQGQRQATD
jgi:hypothetical protein